MNAAPSRAHWNVEPGSSEVNVKVADLLLLCSGGPELMFVWGGIGVVEAAAVVAAGRRGRRGRRQARKKCDGELRARRTVAREVDGLDPDPVERAAEQPGEQVRVAGVDRTNAPSR